MSEPSLQLVGVQRHYGEGETRLDILRGADLTLLPGQSVALIAPVGGVPTAALNDGGRTALRRSDIGFVYQFHHLLPEFSAIENVMMPQLIRGLSWAEAEGRAKELLAFLGLAGRIEHRPAELSGGEQQRVAIARAVANAPKVLLADEPTGNLDPKTAEHVFSTLLQLVKASGLAALIATHNLELARRMDRRVTLGDGQVLELE
jgi:lipoprotein-releasing system ATP-binding protein